MLWVRDHAFESYSDWVLRHDVAHLRKVPEPALLATLYAASTASPPPDPRCAPEWTKRYSQRLLSDLITDCENAGTYGFDDVSLDVAEVRPATRRGISVASFRGTPAAVHHDITDSGSGEPTRIQVLDTARDVPDEDASAQREPT